MSNSTSPASSDTPRRARPLSPHIQIYRWTLTMALSILHRASGIALYASMMLFAAWLWALSMDAPFADWVLDATQTLWGESLLFVFCWVLLHHMFGGLRHFVWDMGLGFSPRAVEVLAWASALLPLLGVAIIWWGAG